MTDVLIESILNAYRTSLGGPFIMMLFALALFGIMAYRYNLNGTALVFGFILITGTFAWLLPAMPAYVFYLAVLAGGLGVLYMFKRLVVG